MGALIFVGAPALGDTAARASVLPGGNVLIDARSPGYAYTVVLTIVGWDKQSVSVDQTSKDAQGVTPYIEHDGSTTKISPIGGAARKTSFFGLFSSGDSSTVYWTVHVPGRSPLRAMAGNSSMEVSGVSAPLILSTSNGEIGITGAGPQLEAKTSNGSVRATVASLSGRDPNIVIRTSNGNVVLRVPRDFHTHVVMRTSNGNADSPFAGANGPGTASINTANGNITVTKRP